jgi:hypothetical protein
LHGMQEVSGSIPLSSTKIRNPRLRRGFFLSSAWIKIQHLAFKSPIQIRIPSLKLASINSPP